MYYLYWILFTCFEIILFVLFIYVISHFLGVQTKYKSFKKSVLHPEEEPITLKEQSSSINE